MFIDYDTRARCLVSQIHTLPHLPAYTPLYTDHVESEQLLGDLITLDGQVDPLEWLMECKPNICVKLLLWHQLDMLLGNLLRKQSHSALHNMDLIGIDKRSSLNIGYRFNEHDLNALKPLAHQHPFSIKEADLLQIFAKLRRREMVEQKWNPANVQLAELRNRLLSLPKDVNPLVWIQENYLHYAAVTTAEYLIQQIKPPEISAFGSANSYQYNSMSPNVECNANDIMFLLRKITYVRAVMSLRITFRITNAELAALEKKRIPWHLPLVDWQGIGALSDDLGNRYLICHYLLNSSTVSLQHQKHTDYNLRVDCFPALVRSANKLRLVFDDVILIAKNAADAALFYAVPLSKLEWTIDVDSLQ